jgi:organic hydroperoxide reductase OsmC/OhrA
MEEQTVKLSLELVDGYEMRVSFDQHGVPPLTVDETAPLGRDRGPNPSRLLAASVASCLSASALFCFRKSRVEVLGLSTSVEVQMLRNEKGRMRIGGMKVALHPQLEPGDQERIRRCLELFEDFCIVTQSVRNGIDVQVSVEPSAG